MTTEPKSLEQLLPHLRRYARSLTGRADQADDLVWECLRRGRTSAHVQEVQTFKILRTCFIEAGLDRGEVVALREAADAWRGPGSTARRDKLAKLRVAYGLLRRDQREVLNLVVMDGMSYEEAGEILDVPAAAVRVRVAQARAELVRRLDDSDQAAVA